MPDRALAPGEQLAGRYRIDGELARGGMARLYQATDERLGRRVAVKVLAAPYADEAASAERFLAEARTAAGISHPNLVSVYDSGSEDGVQFIVMELLEGYRSLREVLAAEGPLQPAHAVELGIELLAGLAAVHERDLVHRDVKSRNLMLGRGRVKLIDFGIAEAAGQLPSEDGYLGSLPYLAPEQLHGEAATPRSDLYAAGVVLYEATTGRLPFEGDNPAELVAAQQRGAIPPSRLAPVSPRLEGVILQALSADPARRFTDAASMSAALRSIDRQHDDTTRLVRAAPAPVPAVRRPRRAGPWLTALLGIGLGLVLAGTLAWGVMNLGGLGPPGATAQPTPAPSVSVAPNEVQVPNVIGMSEEEAQDAVRGTGLRYIIQWREVSGASPGIYDQDPPPGSVVKKGSLLTMYAYRVPD